MSPKEIKEIMEKYDIAPKKLFGQNFLISEGILDKIVKSANLSKNDVVLEVGPGLGALTLKLAPLVNKILAVEKDRNLVKILSERLAEEKNKNVKIIEQDILKFNPRTHNLEPRTYSLIANIPYYLTSVLIRKFLEEENKPSKIILMIQKEVAQRICATPPVGGQAKYDEKMNLLALSVQFYADAKILFYVSKENFWPAPKVDSAVIEITPKEKMPDVEEKLFFKIIRSGFSSKRKQLASNLSQNLSLPLSSLSLRGTKQSKIFHSCHPERSICHPELVSGSKISKEEVENLLKSLNLNPKTRAEELKLEDWARLTNLINNVY